MIELRTRSLAHDVGVEVLDRDLARLDDDGFRAVRAAWQQHPLLLFRRQSLTEPDLLGFSRRFGSLDADTIKDLQLEGPEDEHRDPGLFYVSNLCFEDGSRVGGLAADEIVWHTDLVYRARPATGSIFYGVEMPPGAARTSWCNLARAYRTLPASLRDEVDGKRARCKYGTREPLASFMRQHLEKTFRREASSDAEAAAIDRRTPEVVHDMVLENPATGERSLYLSPNHTVGIENLAPAEGRRLIDALLDHALRAENVYTHDWRNGDVVLWDNARLLHRREAFDARIPRLAKRTTVYIDPARFAVPAAG